MRSTSILLIAVALPLSAAAAQDRVGVAQISPSTAGVDAEEITPAKSPQPTQQLSSDADGRRAQTQLAAPGTSREQPSQVATSTRNTQAPEPLSKPEQGRTASVERVEGHDRCDPANAQQRKTLECRRVIENRAAEYTRPSPTRLSPEQKLLIDQQLQAREEAGRRLASSGQVDGSLEGMGIASIVLDQSTRPREPEKKDADPQSDAGVQAILTILNQPPPQ